MTAERLLEVLGDVGGRDVRHLVERRVHAFHGDDVEAGFPKVLGEDVVEVVGQVGAAEDSLDPQGPECAHVVLPGSEHGHAVLLLPASNDLALAVESQDHEGRRAEHADEVGLLLHQPRGLGLVTRYGAGELLLGSFLKVHGDVDELDARRQPTVELGVAEDPGAVGGPHGAHQIFALGLRHRLPSSRGR